MVEMHAGRELDVLIAQKVFGCVEGKFAPAYSTDIRCAWAVAEQFIAAGCAAWVEGDGHTGYRAGCSNQHGRFEATAETAPHAICLAALKATDNCPTYTHPHDCDHPDCRAAESF